MKKKSELREGRGLEHTDKFPLWKKLISFFCCLILAFVFWLFIKNAEAAADVAAAWAGVCL